MVATSSGFVGFGDAYVTTYDADAQAITLAGDAVTTPEDLTAPTGVVVSTLANTQSVSVTWDITSIQNAEQIKVALFNSGVTALAAPLITINPANDEGSATFNDVPDGTYYVTVASFPHRRAPQAQSPPRGNGGVTVHWPGRSSGKSGGLPDRHGNQPGFNDNLKGDSVKCVIKLESTSGRCPLVMSIAIIGALATFLVLANNPGATMAHGDVADHDAACAAMTDQERRDHNGSAIFEGEEVCDGATSPGNGGNGGNGATSPGNGGNGGTDAMLKSSSSTAALVSSSPSPSH